MVGLPSWTVAGAPLHIRSFLFLSDQGPDEVHADTIIKEELAGMRNSVHLREWCFEHVAHLIAGANLHKHHDYWVALATFTNVFRSSGNPIRVKMEWERLHGKDDPAMAIIRRRLPPRPLRGRWSSAYETEKWLTDCGRWKKLPQVFVSALIVPDAMAAADRKRIPSVSSLRRAKAKLSKVKPKAVKKAKVLKAVKAKKANAKAGAKLLKSQSLAVARFGPENASVLEELIGESYSTYSAKKGKWATNAMNSIESAWFWCSMHISSAARTGQREGSRATIMAACV